MCTTYPSGELLRYILIIPRILLRAFKKNESRNKRNERNVERGTNKKRKFEINERNRERKRREF
jgi:hypothetical protein